ncbi:MAG TPA: cell division protein FtsQ [Rhodobacteraceae bacterium]|nr:cell division protein FtsQ [Paracoccaceae bacterium]
MQQVVPPRHDPAPSRVAYKTQRMMLRPGFRRFLRLGLPVLLIGATVLVVLSSQDRRDAMGQKISDIRRSIEERPEFMVKLMAIDGAQVALAETIRQSLPIDFPISAFDLDLEAMRSEIAALDVVADVVVQVRKGILQITVSERVPALVWRSADDLQLIDAGGHRVVSLGSRVDRSDLQLVAGAGADQHVAQARQIFAAAAPLAHRVRGLERMGQRRWDLVLDRGQRILLPEKQPILALERVIALNTAQDLLARELTKIDMRNAKRPTIRIADSALKALRQIRAQQ